MKIKKSIIRRVLGIMNHFLKLLNLQIVKRSSSRCFASELFTKSGFKTYPEIQSKRAQILRLACLSDQGTPCGVLQVDSPIRIEVDFFVRDPHVDLNVSFMIHDSFEPWISATHTAMSSLMPTRWSYGRHCVRMEFPPNILNRGKYYLRVGLGWIDDTTYDFHQDGLSFDLVVNKKIAPHSIYNHGLLAIVPKFVIVPLDTQKIT